MAPNEGEAVAAKAGAVPAPNAPRVALPKGAAAWAEAPNPGVEGAPVPGWGWGVPKVGVVPPRVGWGVPKGEEGGGTRDWVWVPKLGPLLLPRLGGAGW